MICVCAIISNRQLFQSTVHSIRDIRLYYKLLINMSRRLFFPLVLYLSMIVSPHRNTLLISAMKYTIFRREHPIFIIYKGKENRLTVVLLPTLLKLKKDSFLMFCVLSLLLFNIKQFTNLAHTTEFSILLIWIFSWQTIFRHSIYMERGAESCKLCANFMQFVDASNEKSVLLFFCPEIWKEFHDQKHHEWLMLCRIRQFWKQIMIIHLTRFSWKILLILKFDCGTDFHILCLPVIGITSEPSVVSKYTYFSFIVLHIKSIVGTTVELHVYLKKIPISCNLVCATRDSNEVTKGIRCGAWELRMVKWNKYFIWWIRIWFQIWNLEIYPKSHHTQQQKPMYDSRTQNTHQCILYLFCENGYIVLTFVKYLKSFLIYIFSVFTTNQKQTSHQNTDTHIIQV